MKSLLHHVELPRPDYVMMAEVCPTESYLDRDDRAEFADGRFCMGEG